FYLQLLAAALLLSSVACGLRPPRSFYRRSYYGASGPPGPVRLISAASGPPSYRSDLQTNESKRRDVIKKYPKKTHYRPYTSEEDDYSSERYSGEYSSEAAQDSREYTIGTQIRVQHPITVPKKVSPSSSYPKHHKYTSTGPYKSSGRPVYTSDISSGEDHGPEPLSSKRTKWSPSQFESDADPFHLVPPPKAAAASSQSYRVYEPDHDDYEVPTRPKNHERYKSVASKKQIEAFLEDQQKLLDEAIKLQLINNPKLHKFLKPDSQEQRPDLDIEDFETFPPNLSGPGPLHNSFSVEHPPLPPPKGSRPHRRPPGIELKRSPKPKHILKPKRKYRSTALVINV
ncbi:uncharacterized protein LOC117792875, partial [Drosophila innubila]|uniref:uncharacterized protein LOC117792875 n=1 Tax=Drosophila innubila TaxID=198719 RepID=UPI00148C09C4